MSLLTFLKSNDAKWAMRRISGMLTGDINIGMRQEGAFNASKVKKDCINTS
jgi:hypothetical protein